MHKDEFIKLVLGKPWVDRAFDLDQMDCFGLVWLYYKHVMNINIPLPIGYESGVGTSSCWRDNIDKWKEVVRPSKHGLMLTAYRAEYPEHVGVVIDRVNVLHCRGSKNDPGKVEIHSIAAIKRLFGRVTFHEFIGD